MFSLSKLKGRPSGRRDPTWIGMKNLQGYTRVVVRQGGFVTVISIDQRILTMEITTKRETRRTTDRGSGVGMKRLPGKGVIRIE